MLKNLSYKQKILLNLIPIFLGLTAWFFRSGVPYLSELQRLDSVIQRNFAENADIIYTMTEEDDPHKETHYILSDGKDYAYLNIYNHRVGNTVRFGPTRNVIRLYFQDELSPVTMTEVETGKSDDSKVHLAVVCLDENVESIEVEYHNGGFKSLAKMQRATDKIFDGEVYIPEMRISLNHWNAEYYSDSFTIKGYDKDGNLIRINKCQDQRMEEKLNGKN